jgi:DNA polymerase V
MENFEIIGFQPMNSRSDLPLFSMPVAAGLPVPAESDIESRLDLNEFLVQHPAATFFAKVKGSFAGDIGIADGDILIVDTSLKPQDGKYVLATINGALSIKIYRKIDNQEFLVSGNFQFLPMSIEPYISFSIIGVVTSVIHSL